MNDETKSLDERSSWLSYIFLAHLDGVFRVGSNRPLELDDLGVVSRTNRARVVFDRFSKCFEEQRNIPSNKRPIWHIVWKTLGYDKLLWGLLLFALSSALMLGPVMILDRLVQNFQGSSELTQRDSWILVSLLFLFPILSSLCVSHSSVIMATVGIQLRNALIDAIYRKSMAISPSERLKIGTGKIISMFSDDTNNLKLLFGAIHNVIIAPFQIGALLYLIYQQVGVAVFVGLGYSFVSLPIAGVMMSFFFSMYIEKKKLSDLRVKLVNEILNGIRIIKYYAWEEAFIEKIRKVRNEELTLLFKMGYLFNGVFAFLLLGGPQFQTMLIFLTYIGLGNTLDAATAFTTLTLFGIMTTPILFLSFGLQQLSLATVSLHRIADFLDTENMESYVENLEEWDSFHENKMDNVVIIFDNATFGWSKNEKFEDEAKDTINTQNDNNKYQSLPKESVNSDEENQTKINAEDPQKEKSGEEDLLKGLRTLKTLMNISFSVNEGSLVAIIGSVGCGKSSILQSLMNEMHLHDGRVAMKRNKTFAFCDQKPWVLNATVKDNILFGKDYDESRMTVALQASALENDLRTLTAGIETEIGERGVTLSGGQKARVSLARAIYADADVYLLDDPLSAVDAHVGEHIFRHCIKGCLAKKTVLLVTNQLHVLPQCDKIVMLDERGQILIAGTYEDVSSAGVDVQRFVRPHSSKEDYDSKIDAISKPLANLALSSESHIDKSAMVHHTDTFGIKETSNTALVVKSQLKKEDANEKNSKEEAIGTTRTVNDTGGKLMSDEERNDGDVPWNVYVTYVTYGGTIWFLLTLLTQCATQALQVFGNFWLSSWGEDTSQREEITGMSQTKSFWWFRGYAGFLMASVVMMTVSRLLLTRHRLNASHRFHEQLLTRIFFLKMSFFDVTPVGRIVNRFSQDIATIDEELAQTLSQVVSLFGSVFGSVGAIAAASKGTFLLLLIPLSFFYARWNKYFRKSNTGLARLEAISRSPIFADFSQTLTGITTIHAFRQQDRFIHVLENYVNVNSVPNLMQQIAIHWLGIRLDLLGAIVMFFMGALAVSADQVGFIPAGFLGLGLSYAIQMTALLKYAVTVLCTLEAQFNAVQRVRHYGTELETEDPIDSLDMNNSTKPKSFSNHINTEMPSHIDNKTQYVLSPTDVGDVEMQLTSQLSSVPGDWPTVGKVEFEEVHMRYRGGPLVLKGISFVAEGGDKVGIAGRTGCGKSSLMVALFRLEELAEGKIIIDGMDISRIPRATLRKKLCIIPQEAVLFSATVRFNLDPFDEHTDEEIWSILKEINLSSHVESLPLKLQELVADGGENFSVGQRQLICIGRAILRKPKILVLDEATASIDLETDQLIQRMIRSKFQDCTVLTIAHRLATIMDSTKILVLDAGQVAEYDAPEILLAKELPSEGNTATLKALWERHNNVHHDVNNTG